MNETQVRSHLWKWNHAKGQISLITECVFRIEVWFGFGFFCVVVPPTHPPTQSCLMSLSGPDAGRQEALAVHLKTTLCFLRLRLATQIALGNHVVERSCCEGRFKMEFSTPWRKFGDKEWSRLWLQEWIFPSGWGDTRNKTIAWSVRVIIKYTPGRQRVVEVGVMFRMRCLIYFKGRSTFERRP